MFASWEVVLGGSSQEIVDGERHGSVFGEEYIMLGAPPAMGALPMPSSAGGEPLSPVIPSTP